MKRRKMAKWKGKMLSLTLVLGLAIPQNAFAFTDDFSSNDSAGYVYEEESPANEVIQEITEAEAGSAAEDAVDLEESAEDVADLEESAEDVVDLEESTEAGQQELDISEELVNSDEEADSESPEEVPEENSEELFADDAAAEEFEDGSSEELFTDTETVVYDAAEFDTFKGRTVQEVANRYSEAMLAGATYLDGNEASWYKKPASVKAPYERGELTEDTHKVMTAMTNFYRWLVGVDSLKAVSQHSDSLQVQALIRNFDFAHEVDSSKKPADFPQELWDEGVPVKHNIIAWGTALTPCGAITNWMNEGYSFEENDWDTIGHRYALIGSVLSDVQFGYSGDVAIGKDVAKGNAYEKAFVAFPAPGIMPAKLVDPTQSSWTVELNPSVVKCTESSAVTVIITNLTTSHSDECTTGNKRLKIESQNGASILNFIQPSDYSSSYYTDSYRVEITGLVDIATSSPAKLQYTVDFQDITNYENSYITSVETGISDYTIYKTLSDTESLKKIAAILPQTLKVAADSGQVVSLPVKGPWTVDESGNRFVNSLDASKLPSNLEDRSNLLTSVGIPYIISEGTDYYNTLSFSPNKVKEGEAYTIRVHRTMTSTDTSEIYQLISNENGTYSAKMKFDSGTFSGFSRSGAYDTYECTAAQGDTGEYISVYYNKTWMDDSYDVSMYVSTSIETFTVEAKAHVHTWESDYTTDKEATCTEEGQKSIHCSVCDEIKPDSIEKIPAKGHSWDSGKITKEATCTTAGTKVFTCTKCQTTKSEEIKALNHDWSDTYTVDREATCAQEGEESIHCKRCQEKKENSERVIPKTDHSWGEGKITKPATCTDAGVMEYTCSVCKATRTEEIEATGHEWSEEKVIKQPTCTENGVKQATCTKCGLKSDSVVIPAEGHEWSEEEVIEEPTCTKDGVKRATCIKCGLESDSVPIPAKGHSWDEGKITKAATCKETGIVEYTCSVCADTKTEEIGLTDHKWNETYTVDKDATCTENGQESIHCSVCGEIKPGSVREISAKGHSWDGGKITKAATCTEAGIKEYTCSVCGTTRTEEIEAAGHKWDDGKIAKAATCTEAGIKEYTCSVCGTTRTEEIEAAGHKWDDGKITKAATCTEAGVKEYTCSVCKATRTEEIEAEGHSWSEEKVIKEPTCTEAGVKGATCTKCGLESESVSIPAKGHSWDDGKITKAATCTEAGTREYTCSVCGTTRTEEIEATGHSWDTGTVTKAPTVDTEGERTYTCSRCGSSYTETIPKLPQESHEHVYTSTVTKEATCTEAGVTTYSCSCGDSYTESIPALGHNYTSQVTLQPTTVSEGILTYTCTRCGDQYTASIPKLENPSGGGETAPETGKPFIKDEAGREGWDAIRAEMAEKKDGDTVEVEMNGTTVVPGSILEDVRGKDITAVFDMGGKITWSVNGRSISAVQVSSIDFSVSTDVQNIPEDVLKQAAGENPYVQLHLGHEGEFGLSAVLSIELGKENAGLSASLYYYNKAAGKMESVSKDEISGDGVAEFTFVHASDYAVVIEKQPAEEPVTVSAPVLTAKAAAYNGITLTWSSVSNATGYRIDRKTLDGTWKKFKKLPAGTLTCSDDTIITGKTYIYRIRAYVKSNGKTVWSKYSKAVKAKAPIGKPAVTALKTAKTHRNTLKWSEVPGATGYQVYYKVGKNGTYKKAVTTGKTAFTHKKLKAGKKYYYRVRAYTKVGSGKYAYGSWSKTVSVKCK